MIKYVALCLYIQISAVRVTQEDLTNKNTCEDMCEDQNF